MKLFGLSLLLASASARPWTTSSGTSVARSEAPLGFSEALGTASGRSVNWAGVKIGPPADGFKYVSAFGHFKVGPVTVTPPGPGPWDGVQWIGIGDLSLVQAGVGWHIETSNEQPGSPVTAKSYYLWYEWAPQTPIIKINLPVSVNDEVEVRLHMINPTTAHYYIKNLSTGGVFEHIETNKANPNKGLSVEWIVERPHFSGAVTYHAFPKFPTADFFNCTALSQEVSNGQEHLVNLSNGGSSINMGGTQGQTIATGKILSATEGSVTWVSGGY